MKKRWMGLLLILSLTINMAVIVVAGYQSYQQDNQAVPVTDLETGKSHHFFHVLGLSKSQMAEMEPMAALFHNQLKKLHSAMEIKKDLLIKFLSQKDVTRSQAEQLQKQIALIQENIQKVVISHLLDIKIILNENQQKQFFELLRASMNSQECVFPNQGDRQ
ncbi:MAG: periplasmic heavy metal sensor [Deltaproteobacteria bacterium]|nr:periplasmic heavy metal sensor [Candidatus Desulfobacula maris]